MNPDEEPAYLTSAGDAIAERQRWENDIEAALSYELTHGPAPTSLVAAAWPRWNRVVDRLVSILPPLPMWAIQWMRDIETDTDDDDPNPAATLSGRLAPTLATAAYNTHVLGGLASRGIEYKVWVTRHDPRVRPAHFRADGQKQRLSMSFDVDGYPLQYPGDARTAPIDLWARCRCVVIGRRS